MNSHSFDEQNVFSYRRILSLILLISKINNENFIQSNQINYPQVAEHEEALKYSSYDFIESLKPLISNYSQFIESNYPKDKLNETQTKFNSTLSKNKILSNLYKNLSIHSNYDIHNRLINENIIEENEEIQKTKTKIPILKKCIFVYRSLVRYGGAFFGRLFFGSSGL